MKYLFIGILSLFSCLPALSQTLAEARELYLKGEYEKALPVFEAEYTAKPTDASLNQWYGVCLYETSGDIKKAEECLLVSSKKNIQDSFIYLGKIYTEQYRFSEAEDAFEKYDALVKKAPRRKKEDLEKYEAAQAELTEAKTVFSRLKRFVTNTEDIQIIDSIVVDKADFLSAYKLSHSSGRLEYFNKVFSANRPVNSTVYYNEKENKIYFGQPDETGSYSLFSMEKLLDDFGNEKKLSTTNFGLTGDVNYPFVMPDGVTIYFSGKDAESLGGYDLFVTRYNMNNDTYLAPERLNMPFNSLYNDYMMAVDEEKGIGWFASDRYQPDNKVCVYTFIPNKLVTIIQSEDEAYLANRARITSIKDSWEEGQNYSQLIALARTAPQEKAKVIKDFEFVINDSYTYYKLADFKNMNARDTYYRAIQLKSEQRDLKKQLDQQREAYNKASEDERRNMSMGILDMEKKLEQIQEDVPLLEIQARNMEIESL